MLLRHLKLPWVDVKLNLAGALFVDIGTGVDRHPSGVATARDALTGLELSDFHVGVGGGVRIYLPGVVIPALKLDVGYGIDVNDVAFTLSIGASPI